MLFFHQAGGEETGCAFFSPGQLLRRQVVIFFTGRLPKLNAMSACGALGGSCEGAVMGGAVTRSRACFFFSPGVK